jgi:hypothetical protein
LKKLSWKKYDAALTFSAVCTARWSFRFPRVCTMNRSTSASPPMMTRDSDFGFTVPVDST